MNTPLIPWLLFSWLAFINNLVYASLYFTGRKLLFFVGTACAFLLAYGVLVLKQKSMRDGWDVLSDAFSTMIVFTIITNVISIIVGVYAFQFLHVAGETIAGELKGIYKVAPFFIMLLNLLLLLALLTNKL